MQLNRSATFLVVVALLLAIGLLVGLDAARRRSGAEARFAANRALARWFEVTDLCLFTEARYTRHPSLADRHSPFQDYPLAMEHFPSGSLLLPPAHLAAPDQKAGGRPRTSQ
jgi:hypothetical protein